MIPRYGVTYGISDFVIALKSARSGELPPWRLPGFDAATRLIPTRRGREALYAILKSLELPPKARVGVPLYACSCVAKSVVAAGMTPVYLDVDLNTFGLSLADLERKAAKLDSLVLVHLLGYPADYDRIQAIVGRKPIIEDCAHAIGSSYRGLPLGSLARVAFFTFGFFKPLDIGGGGCIVTRDAGLATRLEENLPVASQEELPSMLAHSCRRLAMTIAYKGPVYSVLTRLKRSASAATDLGVVNQSGTLIFRCFPMRRSDHHVLASRLRAWTSDPNSDYWDDVRANLPARWALPAEPAHGTWNHFIMAVRADGPADCERAIVALRRRGIGAAELYPNCAREVAAYGYLGDCIDAELLARSVFVLPAHANMSTAQRRRIITTLQELPGN